MSEQGVTIVEPAGLPVREGSRYPKPYDAECRGARRVALGNAGGLTQFGVNLVTLAPGAWSSQRHWHSHEDEFVWVVSGELTLVSEAGEATLRPGMGAAFRAGAADGHHLVNRSEAEAAYVEVGTRRGAEDSCNYPDIDLHLADDGAGRRRFFRKSGAPCGAGGQAASRGSPVARGARGG